MGFFCIQTSRRFGRISGSYFSKYSKQRRNKSERSELALSAACWRSPNWLSGQFGVTRRTSNRRSNLTFSLKFPSACGDSYAGISCNRQRGHGRVNANSKICTSREQRGLPPDSCGDPALKRQNTHTYAHDSEMAIAGTIATHDPVAVAHPIQVARKSQSSVWHGPRQGLHLAAPP